MVIFTISNQTIMDPLEFIYAIIVQNILEATPLQVAAPIALPTGKLEDVKLFPFSEN